MSCGLSGELVKRIKSLEDKLSDVESVRNRLEAVLSWHTSIADSLHELDVRITELQKTTEYLRGKL